MKPLLITLLFVFSAHMLRAAVPGAEVLAKLITQEFDTNSDNILRMASPEVLTRWTRITTVRSSLRKWMA
jgi:hypothetical protein